MITPSGPIIINLDSISISTEEKDLLLSNLIGGVILFSHIMQIKIKLSH